MKKYFRFAAVATLVFAVAGAITFVACNKKSEVINNVPQMAQDKNIVYQKSVSDRAAYIIEFEKKLISAEKCGEYMTVENANSFLFDVLNYDFGNIQQSWEGIIYDTTTYNVNVTDGTISLNDFTSLYSQISAHAQEFYNNIEVDNPNYLYIFPKIAVAESNTSEAVVTVTSAITAENFYHDIKGCRSLCDCFIEDYYQWQYAATVLEYCFNLQYPQGPSIGGERWFFSTPVRVGFDYQHYAGLYYGSGGYIDKDEMCTLLINYMGIAENYGYTHGGLYVMGCEIDPIFGEIVNGDWARPCHHYLWVDFATINYSGPGGPND